MNRIKSFLEYCNDTINKLSLWKFFFTSLLTSTFLIFCFLLYSVDITLFSKIGFSLLAGLYISASLTFFFKMVDDSDNFWKSAKEFESLIYEKNTHAELEELYKTRFPVTEKLSFSRVHYSELKRLLSLLEMKRHLLNNN